MARLTCVALALACGPDGQNPGRRPGTEARDGDGDGGAGRVPSDTSCGPNAPRDAVASRSDTGRGDGSSSSSQDGDGDRDGACPAGALPSNGRLAAGCSDTDANLSLGGQRDAGPIAPVRDAGLDAPARDLGGDVGPVDAQAGGPQLQSTGFLMRGADRIFPASASYPADRSPPFTFHDVPAGTKSLALVFVDRSNGATKWVLWDIDPATPGLPENLSKTAHPTELPTSTQRGSLGRTGYSGPGVKGPPLHTYEFTLWALSVARLPVTASDSTTALRTRILPAYALAKGAAFVAKGQLGGP